jgi:hypothetical protein
LDDLDGVGGTKWLVAARQKGEDTLLLVAAMGDKAVVLKRSTDELYANAHNGVYWYCMEDYSFGFAPDEGVELDCGVLHDEESPERLSWRIDGIDDGYRAGSNID